MSGKSNIDVSSIGTSASMSSLASIVGNSSSIGYLSTKNELFGSTLFKLPNKFKIVESNTPIIIDICVGYCIGLLEKSSTIDQIKLQENREAALYWINRFSYYPHQQPTASGGSSKNSSSSVSSDQQNEFIRALSRDIESPPKESPLSTLPIEFVLYLLNCYLFNLPTALFSDIRADILASAGRVDPIVLSINTLCHIHINVIKHVLLLLNRLYLSNQTLLKTLVEIYYDVFFGGATSEVATPTPSATSLKNTLMVMIREYDQLFLSVDQLSSSQRTPKLIQGEEISFGPVHYVRYQINTNDATEQQDSNVNPNVRCITLWVSNYRILYKTYLPENQDLLEQEGIPLSSIYSLKKSGAESNSITSDKLNSAPFIIPCKDIKIVTKDFKVLNIGFMLKSDLSLFSTLIKKLAFNKPVKSMFCFTNSQDTKKSSVSISSNRIPHNKQAQLYNTFNINEEYSRQLGYSIASPPANALKHWRLTHINSRLDICPTYPNSFMMPSTISDGQIKEFAHFRMNKRFPVYSWSNPTARFYSFIAISHQPRLDYLSVTASAFGDDDEEDDDDNDSHTANYDYLLIEEYYKISCQGKEKIQQSSICVYDTGATPRNTFDSFYKGNSKFEYLGLHTYEQTKNSYTKLLDALTGSNPLDSKQKWLQCAEINEWMTIINIVFKSVLKMVESIHTSGKSIVIQSGDGHDFNELLLSSLCQLFLDPYYRTLAGFQVLIQKEWVQFGYPFGKQFNSGSNSSKTKTYLPMSFVIFCHCVVHLLQQYPMDFQFNQECVLFICENIFSCRFGNFVSKTHKDFEQMSIAKNTNSIWIYLLYNSTKFINPNYKSFYCLSVLSIREFNIDSLYFWSEYFTSWISTDQRILTLKSLSIQTQSSTNISIEKQINLNCISLHTLPVFLFHLNIFKIIPNILKIQLSDNYFQYIPLSILKFKNLKELIIDNNLIKDISSFVWQLLFETLNQLETLSLSQNLLTLLPKDLSLGINLKRLNVSDNRIRAVSPHIMKLVELKYLNMNRNQLRYIPIELTNLVGLVDLQISHNQLQGGIPGQIQNLENLETLDLRNNSLNRIPVSISALKNLKLIYLSDNQINNMHPLCLLGESVQEIHLDNNNITEIPMEIQKLVNITVLSLSNNKIQSIPDELMQLAAIKILRLSNNLISWLPPTICLLEKLECLYLSNNQIDRFPETLGMLANLNVLEIVGNKLSGKQFVAKEAGKDGVQDMLNQMKEFIERTQPSLRSKLIFVGHTRMGTKQSLSNLLFSKEKKQTKSSNTANGSYSIIDPNTKSLGYDIDSVFIDVNNKNVELFIWELLDDSNLWPYQSLLLTEKTVYVVEYQFKSKEVNSTVLDYWLNQICSRFNNNNVKIMAVGIIDYQDESTDITDKTLNDWLSKWKQINQSKVYMGRTIDFMFISNHLSSDSDEILNIKQKIVDSLEKKTIMNEIIPSPFLVLEKYIIDKRNSSLATTGNNSSPPLNSSSNILPLSPDKSTNNSSTGTIGGGAVNNLYFLPRDDLVEMASACNIKGRAKVTNAIKFLENSGTILPIGQDYQNANLVISNPQWFLSLSTSIIQSNSTSSMNIKKQDLLAIIVNQMNNNNNSTLLNRVMDLMIKYELISCINQQSGLNQSLNSSMNKLNLSSSSSSLNLSSGNSSNNTTFTINQLNNQLATDIDEWIQYYRVQYQKQSYQVGNMVFLERFVEFKNWIPVSLFNSLKHRFYQFLTLESENTLEKKLAFTFNESENDNDVVRLYLCQFSNTGIQVLLTANDKSSTMFYIQDLFNKFLAILKSLVSSKYVHLQYDVNVVCYCAHCSKSHHRVAAASSGQKPHFFSLDLCELAYLFGITTLTCAQSKEQVALSLLAPDITMDLFGGKIIKESSIVYGKELGRGGFGVVTLGKFNNMDVAIKKLLIDYSRYQQDDQQESNKSNSDLSKLTASTTTNSNKITINIDQINPADEEEIIQCFRDFRREAYVLQRFQDSQHILKLIGVILSPPCLVTEFVGKGDLEKYIQANAPLPLDHAIKLARDIAMGMNEIHGSSENTDESSVLSTTSLQHNDLKPPNILMKHYPNEMLVNDPNSPTGNNNHLQTFAIIADLGTVFDGTGSRVLGRLVDNPIYLAPEVMKNPFNYDAKCDVYSYGVILWEMVSSTGGYFADTTFFGGIEDMIIKGKRPPIPPPNQLYQLQQGENEQLKYQAAASFTTLIQQCWSSDPKQRPSFSTILDIIEQMDPRYKAPPRSSPSSKPILSPAPLKRTITPPQTPLRSSSSTISPPISPLKSSSSSVVSSPSSTPPTPLRTSSSSAVSSPPTSPIAPTPTPPSRTPISPLKTSSSSTPPPTPLRTSSSSAIDSSPSNPSSPTPTPPPRTPAVPPRSPLSNSSSSINPTPSPPPRTLPKPVVQPRSAFSKPPSNGN
ncbi:hypothetical protein CYY_004671 [Polysphondylium violaceum]|uniref:Non-specific serine/threonine protein kinase n=1 Tax=Polysphondylium violaceum TaxID=133409 RepID=A0A8J4PUX8_9MYCE|nr:hypothetical protein CYY_004671 [Polysphondylium violaceum]